VLAGALLLVPLLFTRPILRWMTRDA
jgi:hypothetical protein